MRALVLSLLVAACHGGGEAAVDDRWKAIYDEVDANHLIAVLKDMSGVTPVPVGSTTFSITERFDDLGRQHFRDYWTQYMIGLGMAVTPLSYQAAGHPRAGIDLEAVLPGASADSVVVIVHYDSIGPTGAETANPGADDDMTGMAIMLETARIFAAHQHELAYTVRFVASDEEELGGLAGARAYASHIQAAATAAGFTLVAAVDDEQTGWSCHADGLCNDDQWPAFDIFSCGRSSTQIYNFPALGDQMTSIVKAYSPLAVNRNCIGEDSDHFAMWEIGVPAVVFTEHSPFNNPHFDQNGGDTFDKIDTDYLVSIARPAITFQAALAGIPQY
jgi:hypothetical protein